MHLTEAIGKAQLRFLTYKLKGETITISEKVNLRFQVKGGKMIK